MGFIENLFGIIPCPPDNKEETKRLIDELLRIGKQEDFLSERPKAGFNAKFRHIRAIEIGKRLNQIGGDKLMEFTLYKVRKTLGKEVYSHLEFAWDEIGQWVI